LASSRPGHAFVSALCAHRAFVHRQWHRGPGMLVRLVSWAIGRASDHFMPSASRGKASVTIADPWRTRRHRRRAWFPSQFIRALRVKFRLSFQCPLLRPQAPMMKLPCFIERALDRAWRCRRSCQENKVIGVMNSHFDIRCRSQALSRPAQARDAAATRFIGVLVKSWNLVIWG